jgi:hypothetical protein
MSPGSHRRARAAAAAAAVVALVLCSAAWPALAGDRDGEAAAIGDFTHSPATEQAADTPLPVYFEYSGGGALARVVVKYKGAKTAGWRHVFLKRLGNGWGGLIPCADVTVGPMLYWAQGFDAAGDPVATSGDTKDPITVPIVDAIAGDAPHLPGAKPPKRCTARTPQDDAAGDGAAPAPAASEDTDAESTSKAEAPKKESGTPAGKGKVEDTSSKRFTSEFAVYNDSDHVTVVTPSISADVENVSGASLSGNYLVDVVSAASVDIVSTASSRWQEVRQAGGLSGSYKPKDFGVGVGGSASVEPDYQSFGGFGNVVKDFDQKNWTATFGFGLSHDIAGRCGAGSVCTPFSVFSRELWRGAFNGGLAFVIDRASLGSLTADVIVEDGDQSKPYRYIPMFSPSVAASVRPGASIGWVNANRLPERPLEQLPLERHRAALTGRYAHRFDDSTVRLEERVYDDDWGTIASTTDARWILDLGSRLELWPHARFHAQTSATFWKLAYVSESATGWNLPEYRTGDRELGPLVTVGGGVGMRCYMGSAAQPEQWMLQLTWDAMYTSFLDDLYVTSRTAILGALVFQGQL